MARNEIRINVLKRVVADNIVKKGAYIQDAFALAKADFDIKKQEMLRDFDTHPVTLEIQAGPRAGGSESLNTEGNLFSFLGFPAGTDPTVELREVLEDNTRIVKTSRAAVHRGQTVQYRFPVFAAAIEGELAAASPTRFNSAKSWALAVEGRGFSNLDYYVSHYMYDENRTFPTSFSGPAVQLKPQIREGGFTPREYLTEIIKKFSQKFNKF